MPLTVKCITDNLLAVYIILIKFINRTLYFGIISFIFSLTFLTYVVANYILDNIIYTCSGGLV